jgi:phage terminase large subunit
MTWAPDYTKLFKQRQKRFIQINRNPELQKDTVAYYKDKPVEFINDWCITYDPRNAGRNKPPIMPFSLFPRQIDLIHFLQSVLRDEECGLIEKARDMGATWVSCAFSVWLWLYYPGASIGWGSRKEKLVDNIGDADSIFEKMRMIIHHLPVWLRPKGYLKNKHCPFMKITNPENGATITGEVGDNIGRGGRKLIYFKDESAHYERPDKIEAALGDNTNVQIDISSVCGIGNVFHRRRVAGEVYIKGKTPTPGRTRVFIMDWRDHPNKDQAWYERRKRKAQEDGLMHVFSQEIDRDYTSAIEGILIPGKWVQASIDAHKKLNFESIGKHRAGFDPYDSGLDSHAFVALKGSVFTYAESWTAGDTGEATRKVIRLCQEQRIRHLQYDSVGIGAGVKAEANRLSTDKLLPKGLKLVPWISGQKVQNPNDYIIDITDEALDERPPLNKDFYKNLKAQAYWQLRLRFEKTYRAIEQGIKYDPEELISIPFDLPYRQELEKELSQPVYNQDTSGRVFIDKSPQGTRSPNLADAAVMASFEVIDFDPNALLADGQWAPSGFKRERIAL